MSHRRRAEPQWLRELAYRVRTLAVAQSPSGVSAEVRRVSEERGVEPEELARRIARVWLAQGHIESVYLPVQRVGALDA
ncbi:MAG: hypothetical protein ACRDK7_11085 [Solirubrobacteraceae bacterium]